MLPGPKRQECPGPSVIRSVHDIYRQAIHALLTPAGPIPCKLQTTTFYIKNNGDEELVIEEVKACCGYRILDVSSWEMAPRSSYIIL